MLVVIYRFSAVWWIIPKLRWVMAGPVGGFQNCCLCQRKSPSNSPSNSAVLFNSVILAFWATRLKDGKFVGNSDEVANSDNMAEFNSVQMGIVYLGTAASVFGQFLSYIRHLSGSWLDLWTVVHFCHVAHVRHVGIACVKVVKVCFFSGSLCFKLIMSFNSWSQIKWYWGGITRQGRCFVCFFFFF